MKFITILTTTILIMSTTHATTYEQKGWMGLFAKKPIYENKYSLWQEVQLRYDFENGEMGQSMIRFGMLRPLNEHHEVGALMGYIVTGSTTKEYRPTLQHLYFQTNEDKYFSFRSRLEWRDLENNSSNSVRLRLSPNYRWSFKEKTALAVWDETFFNLTKEGWTGNRLFERNRFFVGLRHDRPGFVFEYGYLNQYVPRHVRDTVEHILVLNLYY